MERRRLSIQLEGTQLELAESDITELEVDAIVNAANEELKLGSGVAGAIREKGGPTIQAECDAIGPISVGDAALTGAGDLPARFVIHAAGMSPGGAADETSIRAALRRSLALAAEQGCRSVAVPALGAGVGGFPPQRCAEVLIEEARAHLRAEPHVAEVRFVLMGEPMYRLFEGALDAAKVAAQMEALRAQRAGRGASES